MKPEFHSQFKKEMRTTNMKFSKEELEDMENAIDIDVETNKAFCPRCGTEILIRQEFNKCPDVACGWRQYMRNKKTSEKYYGS
jgi:hypothetical protein